MTPKRCTGWLNQAAGRTAYLASYHTAQAFVFERDGKVFKTHAGVQTEFLRLTKDDPRVDSELRGFLSRSYNLKALADYETGEGAAWRAATEIQKNRVSFNNSGHQAVVISAASQGQSQRWSRSRQTPISAAERQRTTQGMGMPALPR